MSKTGRPQLNIPQDQFENLCRIQCTETEICAFFNISSDTLLRWCKRTYGKSFAEVFAEKKEIGKISLRRMQYRHAEHNPAMAMFLGKQWLGQRDRFETTIKSDKDDDPITKALKESGIIDGPES